MKFAFCFTLAILTVCSFGWGQPPSDVPVDIEIPFPPIAVKAHGQLHLLYELHLTNFHPQTQVLARVEVDAETGKLAQYTGEALSSLMAHPGAGPGAKLNAAIPGGTRAVVFLDVVLDGRVAVPKELLHELCFRTESATEREKCIDHVQLPVNLVGATLLAAPLRGTGWVALNGLSNNSSHRRTLVVVNGRFHFSHSKKPSDSNFPRNSVTCFGVSPELGRRAGPTSTPSICIVALAAAM